MVSDSNLYTYSNEAAEYFYRLGMIQDTIRGVELNRNFKKKERLGGSDLSVWLNFP
ncbi:MAG: hypothetical protein ACLTOM_11320 [Roseburia sp.]